MKNLILILLLYLSQYGILHSQWTSVSNGLNAYAETILFSNDINIYSGSYDGLSISTDNGIKWKATAYGNSEVSCIFAESGYLYAGGKGIKISTDNGISFSQSLPQYVSISDIIKSGGYLIAGYYNGVYISSNNGTSWDQRQINNSFCRKLISKSNLIFAGCSGSLYMNNGGVFKSANNGNNWVATSLINLNVEFLEANSTSIFAGNSDSVFRSDNNGDTWTKLNLPSWILELSNVLEFEGNIYVNGSNTEYWNKKSFVSNDNGVTWNEYSLKGELISLVKKSNDIIASINYKGVYISRDNAVTWEYYLHKDISVLTFYKRSGRLFAGTTNYGMYYSDDNGNNWKAMNSPIVSVLAFTSNDSYLFAGAYETGIYRSSNNGNNWEYVSLGNRTIYAIHYSNSKLFAGDSYVNIKQSTDNGISWNNNGIPGCVAYCFNDYNGKIFAGLFSQGIFYSTNSGNTWIQSMLTNASISQISYNTNFMFASSLSQPGIVRSSDEGINWEPTNLNRVCWTLLVLEDYIIAGTGIGGVFVSNDNGFSWRSRNDNIGSNNVAALIDHNGYVFAGLSENGINKIALSELTDIEQTNNSVPDEYMLSQNYPNPFNPTTKINYELRITNYVSVKVFDVLGNEVAALVNENKPAGSYSVDFDGADLPSGIYFYKLESGNFSDTKRMILLK